MSKKDNRNNVVNLCNPAELIAMGQVVSRRLNSLDREEAALLAFNAKDKNFPHVVLFIETWLDLELTESETIAGLVCPSCQNDPEAPVKAMGCFGTNARVIAPPVFQHKKTVH
jgi:hypothetical protein